MSGIRRALALSFLERYILLVVGLGSNMVIARILTPEAIGIYSVSLAFIGIAQVLRDFGVASYLIQERDLTDDHVRTAFGLLLLMGGLVFASLFLGAPWIGRLYSQEAMVPVLRVCALNFLVLPFCTVSLALLRRHMAFKSLTAIGVASATAGAAASVGLAFMGYGAVGLAIGAVVVNVVTGFGAWWASTESKVMLPSLKLWRTVLGFGAQTSVSGVVTSVAMDINDLAVGKIMGVESVALISRAQGLMNLFHRDIMSSIRNVAFPAFAKAVREKSPMEPIYITSVSNVCVVAWPFYGFASLFALELLRLLFGPQWDAAAPLVPVFCLAGAVAATHSLVANLVIAAGRVDLVTRFELVFQPLRAVLIVMAALVFKSTMACAWALVIALCVHTPFIYRFKGQCLPNDFAVLMRRLSASAAVAVIGLLPPAAIALHHGLTRTTPVGWGTLFGAAAACIVTWLVALIALGHPMSRDAAFLRMTAPVAGLLRRSS